MIHNSIGHLIQCQLRTSPGGFGLDGCVSGDAHSDVDLRVCGLDSNKGHYEGGFVDLNAEGEGVSAFG